MNRDNPMLVVKFGGASVGTPELVGKAARSVVELQGKGWRPVVVVSAMGRTTDDLLQLAYSSAPNLSPDELDEVVSMGERTSARVFAAALSSLGARSLFLDPSQGGWPIITDENHGRAQPVLETCSNLIPQAILPAVEQGAIPVVPGFVGRSTSGRVTTLGRGGSDTTAFLLATALGCETTILVTSAEGIMTADPKIIRTARRLDRLTAEELASLSDTGAKFIHRNALRYLGKGVRVKIVSYLHGDLEKEGTWVEGTLPSLEVEEAVEEPATAIVLAGRDQASVSKALECILRYSEEGAMTLLGVVANSSSVVAYVKGTASQELLERIHEQYVSSGSALGVAVRGDLAPVRLHGAELSEKPGVLKRVAEPLAANGINIHGALTLGSSFILFVNRAEAGKAVELIRNALNNVVG